MIIQDSTTRRWRPDQVSPPFNADIDEHSDLLRAATPVTDRLADDLSGTDISVVVSDAGVRIVSLHAPRDRQRRQLEALSLAPGFVWSVDIVGTNALGIASEHQRPTLVEGNEHFMVALASMSMASAPVIDPRTGQLLGAVTLACPSQSANSLLLPVARRAAREVEQRLLDGSSAGERLLEEHFLRARRRSRAPLAVVGERTLLMNAAASRLLEPSERPRLWALAEQAVKLGRPCTTAFEASEGSMVVATVETVPDGVDIAGVILRLQFEDDATNPASVPAPRGAQPKRPAFGWASLTETERGLAELVAGGLTNKQAAARLFLSRHTIDTHLRHIYQKLEISSRVDLARLVTAGQATAASELRDPRV